jgi:flagellar basal-body rod protein FlgB
MGLIDPTTLSLVSSALNAASLRHLAHAQNIANANVPGAKPMRVSFEEHLGTVRAALEAHQPLNASDVPAAQAYTVASRAGAHIELDSEVAALSSNSLQYQALVRALGKHIGMMSLAVSDGRR